MTKGYVLFSSNSTPSSTESVTHSALTILGSNDCLMWLQEILPSHQTIAPVSLVHNSTRWNTYPRKISRKPASLIVSFSSKTRCVTSVCSALLTTCAPWNRRINEILSKLKKKGTRFLMKINRYREPAKPGLQKVNSPIAATFPHRLVQDTNARLLWWIIEIDYLALK